MKTSFFKCLAVFFMVLTITTTIAAPSQPLTQESLKYAKTRSIDPMITIRGILARMETRRLMREKEAIDCDPCSSVTLFSENDPGSTQNADQVCTGYISVDPPPDIGFSKTPVLKIQSQANTSHPFSKALGKILRHSSRRRLEAQKLGLTLPSTSGDMESVSPSLSKLTAEIQSVSEKISDDSPPLPCIEWPVLF